MSIHKRIDKKGVVHYDVSWYTPEGKQKWRAFDKKKEAKDFEAKVRAAKKENKYHDVFDIKAEYTTTFNELADKYVEIHKGQRCFRGFKEYVIRGLRERFCEKKLAQIGRLELELWVQERKDAPTTAGKPRSPGSVNIEIAVLKHMLSKAVEWKLLLANPFKEGKRLGPKVDNKRTRFLSESEIEALLGECPDHLKPIVQTALLTGMRKEEILSLKWEQMHHGSIHLEGSMCKSGKGRKIPINGQLGEVFKELRGRNQLKSPHVFCNFQGKRLNVNAAFRGACRRAGIENFRFHDLRHTFASRLVMRGASLKAVQELLGHADLSMTMRYSHLSQEHLQDAVSLLNDTPGISRVLYRPQATEKDEKLRTANLP